MRKTRIPYFLYYSLKIKGSYNKQHKTESHCKNINENLEVKEKLNQSYLANNIKYVLVWNWERELGKGERERERERETHKYSRFMQIISQWWWL